MSNYFYTTTTGLTMGLLCCLYDTKGYMTKDVVSEFELSPILSNDSGSKIHDHVGVEGKRLPKYVLQYFIHSK